ncbi:hypothetical protein K227x_49430 [Rubripirellula lacrimiformis]|uniref:Uncharacterized protein n=2 Tax=Rubripirellula lacrimiformis TaxID=1930273 RepID=A0A517NHK4_9BACT|nr:hypothetical protein K227x_49430 [Rubripirellula lacrimiformis]
MYVRSPATRSLGNTASGLEPVDGCAITPQQAVAIAEPYLETSFNLRSRNLLPERRNSDKSPTDWVTLRGDTYFVARDNYAAINVDFYISYAVAVHAETGALTAPTSHGAGS